MQISGETSWLTWICIVCKKLNIAFGAERVNIVEHFVAKGEINGSLPVISPFCRNVYKVHPLQMVQNNTMYPHVKG